MMGGPSTEIGPTGRLDSQANGEVPGPQSRVNNVASGDISDPRFPLDAGQIRQTVAVVWTSARNWPVSGAANQGPPTSRVYHLETTLAPAAGALRNYPSSPASATRANDQRDRLRRLLDRSSNHTLDQGLCRCGSRVYGWVGRGRHRPSGTTQSRKLRRRASTR